MPTDNLASEVELLNQGICFAMPFTLVHCSPHLGKC